MLAKLKKQRTPLRAGVTRSIAAITAELLKTPPCITKLQAELEILEDLNANLMDTDQKILEIMLDEDVPDAEWDTENEAIQVYKAKFITARVNANSIIHITIPRPPSPTPSEAGSSTSQRRTYKLPKIELKKFSGELTEWIGWWAQFQKIDEDDELHETDKFQYLFQSMVSGTRAYALVERYPQSKENYPKVISALKERFGKPKLLTQVYVRELIHMIINKGQDEGKSALATLFDKLESHLRSLESLGVTIEQMAMFLFPMVESCIPRDIFIAWQRSSLYEKDGSLENPPKSELDFLLQFLKQEIDREEQRNLAESGFGLEGKKKFDKRNTHSQVSSSQWKRRSTEREESYPTAAGLFSGEAKSCVFCDGNHSSSECRKARTMDLGAKRDKLKTRKACFNCFKPGHMSKECRTSVSCAFCSGEHLLLFCPDHPSNKSTTNNTKPPETSLANLSCSSEVILQTLIVRVNGGSTGKSRLVRALIDSGSQRSYISTKAVEEIGLAATKEVTLNHILFGGVEKKRNVHNVYQVRLNNIRGQFHTTMEMLNHSTICGTIPRVEKGSWMHELRRKKIFVSDLSPDNPTEVEMLIGSDNLGKIVTGNIYQLGNGLTATETKLGWTLMGRTGANQGANHGANQGANHGANHGANQGANHGANQGANRGANHGANHGANQGANHGANQDSNLAMRVISATISCTNVSDLWSLETLGIRDPVEVHSKTEKERLVKEHFKQTVKRGEDGRYVVSLPWVDTMKNIPSNREVAGKRLEATTNKLVSQGRFQAYDEIFHAWEREGIISQCTVGEPERCHYLPHRAVFKESKTTPVRPVFDASCKVGRAPSLNDCLEKGPNLLELIPDILIRFRLGKVGAIADIRKAFLMINVDKVDRDFLRFLWWEDYQEKKLKIFQHNRVVFGVNCSPFLLAAVIEHHLGQYTGQQREYAQKLAKSLYVDNLVTSVNTTEEYEMLKNISTQLMVEAKMELREWECSKDNSTEPVTSVLGLKWDKGSDELFCEGLTVALPEKITKRIILSEVQKIFDPLGFLCPTLLMPKLLLQRTWTEKNGWDEAVSEAIRSEFVVWLNEMHLVLGMIRIPRMATTGEGLDRNTQLHLFTDASKTSYAAVVYLRMETASTVSVQLLEAKSRVAPVKKTTIPRLELLSCSIGARLLSTVKEALKENQIPVFCWSDSTTALAWIKRNDDWGTFVGNRVKEICSLTSPQHWRHVPGIMNPADLPSRGCSPSKLLESRWWEGPAWLKQDSNYWPSGEGIVDEDLVRQERKKSATMAMSALSRRCETDILHFTTRHSSFNMNVRILAMVLRFIKKLKKTTSESGRRASQFEIDEAEVTMFRLIQEGCFTKGLTVICGLRVMTDSANVIRVVTKLTNRQDSVDFRYPVLLPTPHPLVEQLVREEHIFNCHGGVQLTMTRLRERCWLAPGRKYVKTILRSCVTCRRYNAGSLNVPTAPLPEDRVKNTTAFEVTGVDLAGPLILKNKSKTWIVLFTCAVYRCVHLELVESLSTEDFLMSLVRFCKRKRRPSVVYSDNGTNFVGTVNLFKYIDWKAVEDRTRDQRIQWKFNPPSAPWWGGWWERLIRSIKDLLRKMLGFRKLSLVQLETCLCEVESAINHRPLTFITEDQDDLIPLTPAMFIHDLPVSGCPEAKLLRVEGLQGRVKDLHQLGQELRSRFREEYLAQLVQRGKERRCEAVSVGDVVLVGADNRKRIEWPMARIIELMPGKDGNVRVARLKTALGEITRPIQRLYPLEVSSQDKTPPIPNKVKEIGKQQKARTAAVDHITPPVNTRSGRQVKRPDRYQ